jgi:hypothetical protein
MGRAEAARRNDQQEKLIMFCVEWFKHEAKVKLGPTKSLPGNPRFKCSFLQELKAVDSLPVHELSAVKAHCLRFKYRPTHVVIALVGEPLHLG